MKNGGWRKTVPSKIRVQAQTPHGRNNLPPHRRLRKHPHHRPFFRGLMPEVS